MDLRWQMVLDCLGAEDPPFSQGSLFAFRERLIESGGDRLLLERTVSMVRDGVADKKEGHALSKALRVASDSRPLVGAGKVEDTINLLGPAVEHSLVHVAARKGHKARYLGVRKNLLDLRRAAAIQNLEATQRINREAA